ncbi:MULTISPECIES: alkaline phosphatase D family protein [Ramlibacter]|uniref:Alkaline phosphatase D family protein n=1 Tax=Ramlibacter aquaticus TaxID=2780094 RepID=A0ABR9SDP1_9BURK|nr:MULTISPECIES: alkaline phosphatase D family protein [Ramlibacter]MBE7940470.1 alkaline phosphatase D family protein [Ramlibacter aquaticus]
MDPLFLDRRRWLQAAASAAATLWLPRAAWSQPRLQQDPFTLGVASGSPSPDGMVLWTRLQLPTGAPAATVRWEVAHDAAFTRIVRSGQSQALPELAHSVHAEVQGLAPDRWYHYRFMAGDAVSPVGRTRTLPAPDAAVARLRIAYASCQRWEHGYFTAWRHMRADEPDLVLFLGDYIYEYAGASHPVRPVPGGWVMTLEDYRARYALYKGDADLQAIHAACPWISTWDDHEVMNDYAGTTAGFSGAGSPPDTDFKARRAAAYQAYYEHMPLRAATLTRAAAGLLAGEEVRLYGTQRLGRLGRLVLLDDRQYRDAQVCNKGGRLGSSFLDVAGCPNWDDPRRTLLGETQQAWLEAELARPEAGWTVFGQQTLFGQRDTKRGPGQTLWNDGWDGYRAARSRVTGALQANRVRDVVLLGGDVHENWVGHVKADYDRPDSETLGVEFCGTSISSRAFARKTLADELAENPHFVFADIERKGYGIAEFTPGRLVTSLRVLDDVARSDSGVQTLARFTVQAGRPLIEREA